MDLNPQLLPYTVSNAVPPEHLIPSLEHSINQLTELIKSIDTQLAPLEDAVARLKKSKLEATAMVGKLKSARSPVRSLPSELVASIIQFALGENLSKRPLDRAGRQAFAGLRRVCKHWREAALSAPGLWRDLLIRLSQWSGTIDVLSVQADFSAKLDNWFAKGGVGAPLHLCFWTRPRDLLSIAGVINVADQHGWRITTLELGAESGASKLLCSHELTGNSRTCMGLWNLQLTWDVPVPVEYQDHFPQLRSLNIWRSFAAFAHSGLRSLTLCTMRLRTDEMHKALRQLPCVEELVFFEIEFMYFSSPQSLPAPASFPSIQRFTTSGTGILGLGHLSTNSQSINSFIFPSMIFYQHIDPIVGRSKITPFFINSDASHLTLSLVSSDQDYSDDNAQFALSARASRIHFIHPSNVTSALEAIGAGKVEVNPRLRDIVVKNPFSDHYDFVGQARQCLSWLSASEELILKVHFHGGNIAFVAEANRLLHGMGMKFMRHPEGCIEEMLSYPPLSDTLRESRIWANY
jgi:exonuclease VII small subunit